MTLKQWLDNGWLRPHQTSREEIGRLLAIVERDLGDAEGGIPKGSSSPAVLVTAYRPDPERWMDDFRRRKK
jgi:hypothetical protein